MIILIITLLVLLLTYTVAVGLFLSENGGMLDDQTLEDYLNKMSDNYDVYMGEYSQRIMPTYSAKVSRYIERSPVLIGLLFPYYIEYVGLIPAWSKSKTRIDAMFAQGVKRNWKREKLGLD